MGIMSTKPPKLRHACNECHMSKVKCSGERSGCTRCVEAQRICSYSVSMVGKVQGHRKRTNRRQRDETRSPRQIATPRPETEQHRNLDRISLASPRGLDERPATAGSCDNRDAGNDVVDSLLNASMLRTTQESNNSEHTYNDTNIDMTTLSDSHNPLTEQRNDANFVWDLSPDGRYDDGMSLLDSLSFNPPFDVDSTRHSVGTPNHQDNHNRVSSCDCGEMGRGERQLDPRSPASPTHLTHQYAHQHPYSQSHPHSQSQYRSKPINILSSGSTGNYHDDYHNSSASVGPDLIFDVELARLRNLNRDRIHSRKSFSVPSPQSSYATRNTAAGFGSWHGSAKCLVVISKLERLVRESVVSLDVLLATNKDALAELSGVLDSSEASLSLTTNCYQRDHNSNWLWSSMRDDDDQARSHTSNPIALMIYVIALKHISELYTQACAIFLMQDGEPLSSELSSSGSSDPRGSSTSSSCSTSSSRDTNRFGLPQLDFGSFKIDVADRRRLFSGIIAGELSSCLRVCERIRMCFAVQPGDISAPTGLLEDTFVRIEELIRRLIKKIKD